MLARCVQGERVEPFEPGETVLDPKVLLMLATGTLLLLNGLIARAAAAKRAPDDVAESSATEDAPDPNA